jgi:hypothetical protein
MKIAVTLFPIAGALLLTSSALFAQTAPWEELIATARKGSTTPGLKDVITKTLSAHGGNAIWGQDYLFVAESPTPATISIDSQPAVAMASIPGSALWMHLVKMRTGATHSYQFYADGKALGARGDAVGYNPDSYQQPGVPHGKATEKRTIVSKIYDGSRLLDLCVAWRGPRCPVGADGLAGRPESGG